MTNHKLCSTFELVSRSSCAFSPFVFPSYYLLLQHIWRSLYMLFAVHKKWQLLLKKHYMLLHGESKWKTMLADNGLDTGKKCYDHKAHER